LFKKNDFKNLKILKEDFRQTPLNPWGLGGFCENKVKSREDRITPKLFHLGLYRRSNSLVLFFNFFKNSLTIALNSLIPINTIIAPVIRTKTLLGTLTLQQ
jgi:hypothetical protein